MGLRALRAWLNCQQGHDGTSHRGVRITVSLVNGHGHLNSTLRKRRVSACVLAMGHGKGVYGVSYASGCECVGN